MKHKKDKRRVKKHICQICGCASPETQIHHVFSGSYRAMSERNDFVLELCPRCHRQLHDNSSYALHVKKMYQLRWESQHSHDEWMRLAGRSWA